MWGSDRQRRSLVAAAGLPLVLSACVVFVEKPPSVDFAGRTYTGTGSEYYLIGDRDVSPVGVADAANPPSDVADLTVFQVGEIPVEELIALRAAPGQGVAYLIYIAGGHLNKGICDFARPNNPPSLEDCPEADMSHILHPYGQRAW